MKAFWNLNFLKLQIFISMFLVFIASPPTQALVVNNDGKDLILESEQTYRKDMNDRPVMTDKAVIGYAEQIVNRLKPANRVLPEGVTLHVTVLDSPQPELYSYTSGQIVVTMGTLMAVENEAQLAGVLAHEVANVTEGYYISMYQEIKAAERNERRKAMATALMSSLMDVAVDFAVDIAAYEISDDWYTGDETYKHTHHKLAGLYAAKAAYFSIKDVMESTPKKDEKGQWIDPRLRLEPVADAQGMHYTALAGYDCREAAKGWENLYRIKQKILKEQEAAFGPWAEQLRQTRTLMQANLDRMRQTLGITGLVQTRSDIPATRSKLVAGLVKLSEVKEAEKTVSPKKETLSYQRFLKQSVVPRANKEMEDENYEKAYMRYTSLWDKGIHTAPIAYGKAKSKLGDFAFGATESEKREAEKEYKKAIQMDPKYAAAYKGLGELYEDWDRYEAAARSFQTYLKLSPDADDKRRIQRKIKTCRRKADR